MEFQQRKHWKCWALRSLIIRYREPQSWNDTNVSRPAGTSLKMMLVSVSGDNVEIIKEMIMSNRRITVEELAEEISISHGSCHVILCNHLKMRRVAAKVVPKLLTFEQNNIRQSVRIYSKLYSPNITQIFQFCKLL